MMEEEPANTPQKAANFDEAIQSQQRDIEEQIAKEQQYFVSSPQGFSQLESDYADHEDFLNRIAELKQTYKSLRRTRADGNCFYRAFGFAAFEALRNDNAGYQKFRKAVTESKDFLLASGYEEFTVTDFYDNFVDELDKACGGDNGCQLSQLEDLFNDRGMSNYLVVFLRLVTSSQMQKEQDFYINFLDGMSSVKQFCTQEIEPMDKESDHVQMMALTSATGICMKVFCMERGQHSTVTFPSDGEPMFHLLYRPGHFDILYTAAV